MYRLHDRYMEMAQYLALLLLSLTVQLCHGDALPGHMQPLGSHMEPELIRRIDYMPTPLEFNEQFVGPKIPVVFEGAMADQEVLKNWQNDQYLRSHYGDAVLGVETGKKENRSEGAFPLPLRDFLDRYKEEDIYMVSDLPEAMFKDWVVPKFILCGGYMQHLMFVYFWFSSGGTKSVVHTDSYENLHCLVSGQKRFLLIEPQYAEEIGPEYAGNGYFNIDVDRVNMTAYPNLAKIPWYSAVVNPGDCFYLPYLWIHNVNSEGRNMGVNVWWSPFKFQRQECPDDWSLLPDFASLESADLAPELQLIEALQTVVREDGAVYMEDVYELMATQLPQDTLSMDHASELFDILLPGCNGVLRDLDQIPRPNVREAFEYLSQIADAMQQAEYERMSGFDGQGQPLSDEEYNQRYGRDEQGHPPNDEKYQHFEEFGGEEELDIEDLWEGPISEQTREGGGDYQDRNTKRDEL